jgi:hypothetical protein
MITFWGAWAADVFNDGEINPNDPVPSGDPMSHYMVPMIIILVLVALALALPPVVFALALEIKLRKADQARIPALQAWAQEQGYYFRAEEPDLARIYPGLPLAPGGQGALFQNVIRGRLGGRPFTAFDYCYQTTTSSTSPIGRPKTRSVPHRRQVVAIEGPGGWPALRVFPQEYGSEPAITFGRQDVPIGQDDFDSVYRVRAYDEDAARRMLVPLAPTLLARTDQEFWVDDRTILALRLGKLQATVLETWLGQLKAVLRAMAAVD